MIRKFALTAAFAGTVALAGCAGPVKDDKVTDFVQKASIANLFEIKTSQLALQRAINPDVKTFAQEMITDHTKAGSELKAALQTDHSPAQPATTLDDAHQKMLDDLTAAAPDAFDDKYIDIQTKAHDEALSLFKDYADGGKDGPVRQFATETLPVLQTHKDHVKMVDDATHSGTSDGSESVSSR
jgi:putative membrane protein